MEDMEKIYHCCRFCHWYNGGCNHENTFAASNREDYVDALYLITEKGHIHDAIKEVMDADAITEIIRAELADTRLSKKSIDTIVKSVAEQVEEKNTDQLDSRHFGRRTGCVYQSYRR